MLSSTTPLVPNRIIVNKQAKLCSDGSGPGIILFIESVLESLLTCPKGPCIQIVYTLGPMSPYREYLKKIKANVYTIWAS